jgi:hypothetical protein
MQLNIYKTITDVKGDAQQVFFPGKNDILFNVTWIKEAPLEPFFAFFRRYLVRYVKSCSGISSKMVPFCLLATLGRGWDAS